MRTSFIVLSCLLIWVSLTVSSVNSIYFRPVHAKTVWNCIGLRRQASQIGIQLQALEKRIAEVQEISNLATVSRFSLVGQFLFYYPQFANLLQFRNRFALFEDISAEIRSHCWLFHAVCFSNPLMAYFCLNYWYVKGSPAESGIKDKMAYLDEVWYYAYGKSSEGYEIEGAQKLLPELHKLLQRVHEVRNIAEAVVRTRGNALSAAGVHLGLSTGLCAAALDLNALRARAEHVAEPSNTLTSHDRRFLLELIQIVERHWYFWLLSVRREAGTRMGDVCWMPWDSIAPHLMEAANTALKLFISPQQTSFICAQGKVKASNTSVESSPVVTKFLAKCSTDTIRILNLTEYESFKTPIYSL